MVDGGRVAGQGDFKNGVRLGGKKTRHSRSLGVEEMWARGLGRRTAPSRGYVSVFLSLMSYSDNNVC